MLETCRGGPRPIRLCVEKIKNFDEIQPSWKEDIRKKISLKRMLFPIRGSGHKRQ